MPSRLYIMPTLSTTLTRPTFDGDALMIRQQEYGPTDGILSRAGLHRAIIALLADEPIPEPDCVDECATELYVYRRDLTLNYRLHVSHGILGQRIREDDVYYAQKIKLEMDDRISFDLPSFGVVDHRWLGDTVWNHDGSEIPPPSFTATMDGIEFAAPVYGTIVIGYRLRRDRYDLRLPRRDDAKENSFASVAYAVFNDGPVWHEVEPPPGAEETGAQCYGGGGGSSDITGPEDDDSPPTAPHRDAREIRDYCSQEVISDTSK